MMLPLLQDMMTDLLGAATTRHNILMLGGASGPTSGADAAVFAFLQAKYSVSAVEYMQGSASVTEDAIGRDLVIISSTLASSAARGKFNNSPVPVMNWEEALMKSTPGDFEFSSGTAKPTTTDINVIDDTHPIMVAAGFSNGLVTIGANNERNCPNGTIAVGVDVLAEHPTDPACKIVSVADQGALDFNSNPFPARRGMFPITDSSFNGLNANGLALFDAMLDWLVG